MQSFIDFCKNLPCGHKSLGEGFAHADGLRALPRKYKGFRHTRAFALLLSLFSALPTGTG
jgi:hypothetical protein